MTDKKMKSLMDYSASLIQKLASPTPNKWSHAPKEYKTFLERELKKVNTR